MNIEELKSSETEYHAKVVIARKDLTDKVESELSKAAKKVRIDGFRPGKAPLSMVRKMYQGSVFFDVLNDSMNTAVKQILDDKKFDLIIRPEVKGLKNEGDTDIEFICEFEFKPVITLPDFKSIKIEVPEVKIEEKEIESELEAFAHRYKIKVNKGEQPAQKGDCVVINGVGYVDGVAFDGGNLKDFSIDLGSGSLIPGFEDQLIGAVVGQKIDINVTFPQEYHAKDLAGKPAIFRVEVAEVSGYNKPELTDQFVKEKGLESLEKLKGAIRKNLEASYAGPTRDVAKARMFDHLEKMVSFDVPKSLLKQEKERLLSQLQKEDMKDDSEIDKISLRRVRMALIIENYAKEKSVKITEEDLNNGVSEYAAAANMNPAILNIIYKDNRDFWEGLRGLIFENKVIDTLLNGTEVNVTKRPCTAKELEEMMNKIGEEDSQ